VVLYGYETWSLILREKHGLRVLEDRELRRIFGPKSDEVTGGWRKLHTEKHHNLYSSPSTYDHVKEGGVGKVCRAHEEKRNGCGILVGKPEGKRQLGSPRRRLVGNIKMDLRERGWGGVDWIDLAQDRGQ
jgi:hypothetical protein